MDNRNFNIEKFDSLRSRLLIWTTIGFAVWYGMNILMDLTTLASARFFATFLGLAASVVWMTTLIKLLRLARAIQKEPNLRHALNDELFLHNKVKAFETGYWCVLLTVVTAMAVSIYITIPALLVCKIILYVAVLSFLSAAILYNRA